jgi:hypothetical protein
VDKFAIVFMRGYFLSFVIVIEATQFKTPIARKVFFMCYTIYMLTSILIAVIVLGLILWLVQTLPIAEPFKQIAIVIVVVMAILYLVKFL